MSNKKVWVSIADIPIARFDPAAHITPQCMDEQTAIKAAESRLERNPHVSRVYVFESNCIVQRKPSPPDIFKTR